MCWVSKKISEILTDKSEVEKVLQNCARTHLVIKLHMSRLKHRDNHMDLNDRCAKKVNRLSDTIKRRVSIEAATLACFLSLGN